MKVLLVEDELEVAALIQNGLEQQGFTVDLCHDGRLALERASEGNFDVVVLDIMLPGRDGLSVLRTLRGHHNTIPVILLTARGTLEDRLTGLDLGADDYLTKPFYVEELISRIRAVLRRRSGDQLTVLRLGDLTVNLITREVRNGADPVRLTIREFGLLEYLMRSPGRVYTRTQIIEHVWGYLFDPNTNLVDVYIKRLRKKLQRNGGGTVIETVRGVGYRLAVP